MTQKLLTILTLFLTSFLFSQTVVINEIDADTPGSDTLEFIELKSFDAGGVALPNYPLDGYVIVFYNGANDWVYRTIDLDGFVTDINGIIHFGNSAVSPSPAATIPPNGIQNGPEVVAIYNANATDFPIDTATIDLPNLIDAIAYSNNTTQPTSLMTSLGISVFMNENANGLKDTQSIQRKNDGSYEVKNSTPGVNNDGSGVVLNYITVTTAQPSYTEGDSFNIVFTTSQPVQNETLIMNFSLTNGNFSVGDFSGGLTVSIPVGQTTTQTGITLYDDSSDEGDEEALFQFATLPSGYVANNDNFIIRVYDINFATDPWGTPLNPTFGLCPPQIPAGYYDSLEGLSGAALKQELQNIITNGVRAQSYGDVWDIFDDADRNPENNNQVWQIYTEGVKSKLDQQVGSSGSGFYQREHIWPQSRGGFSDGTSSFADGIDVWLPSNANDILAGHSDAHHIRAVDGDENNSRSNRDYGVDYNGPTGNTGSWHGDVARALFFMAVRYNGLDVVNGNPVDSTVGQMGDLATLLSWNTSDPADDFEMNRNNVIYNWQMNRNPFIDYPLLADYIFGANFGNTWSFSLSNENFTENSIKVYPNPTTDYVMIDGVEGIAKVEVYNLTGQNVLTQDFENQIRLDIDLASGIYFVKVKQQTKEITKKIVIR